MSAVFPKDDVVIIPWYARKDFDKLRSMNEGERLQPTYDAWHASAQRELLQLMAGGYTVKVVPLHVDDYSDWLGSRDEDDTASSRSSYLAHLAKAQIKPEH